MKILSIECAAVPVSAAVTDDGEILGYTYSDVKLTHSQTLLPVIESALSSARVSISDIDAIGVSTGPGSFTGVRIGISCAKGIAQPRGLKCAGVSSLLSAAYMFSGENAIICPVIDARCGQVYNALFEVSGESVRRICEDRAIMIEELIGELKGISEKKVILCCDAAPAVISRLGGQGNVVPAPKSLIHQNAVGVALCAYENIKSGNFTDSTGLNPTYLKLPQAERELREKQKKGL